VSVVQKAVNLTASGVTGESQRNLWGSASPQGGCYKIGILPFKRGDTLDPKNGQQQEPQALAPFDAAVETRLRSGIPFLVDSDAFLGSCSRSGIYVFSG